MSYMFDGYNNLTSLDVSNFNTANVTNMGYMFDGCVNLTSLNLTSFNTSNVTDMVEMFMNRSGSLLPLVVIATDSKLLNYGYSADGRIPPSLTLNANGGAFAGRKTELNYFTSCAIHPDNLPIAKFTAFKEANVPTKKAATFEGYTPSKDDSSAKTVLDLIGTVYKAQWKNNFVDASIVLQLKDKETKEPLAGATFELQDKDGKTVSQNLTTDKNGEIRLSMKLMCGQYAFVETKGPDDYQLDSIPVSFEIIADQPSVTVVIYNEKLGTKSTKPSTIDSSTTDTTTVASNKEKSKSTDSSKNVGLSFKLLPKTGTKKSALSVIGIIIILGVVYVGYRK